MNSTETTLDKAPEVHTFVGQLTGINGCTGLDQRQGAANFLSAVQGDDGVDAASAQVHAFLKHGMVVIGHVACGEDVRTGDSVVAIALSVRGAAATDVTSAPGPDTIEGKGRAGIVASGDTE